MNANAKYLISNVFLLFTHKRDPISGSLELIANVSEMDLPKKTVIKKKNHTQTYAFLHIYLAERSIHTI